MVLRPEIPSRSAHRMLTAALTACRKRRSTRSASSRGRRSSSVGAALTCSVPARAVSASRRARCGWRRSGMPRSGRPLGVDGVRPAVRRSGLGRRSSRRAKPGALRGACPRTFGRVRPGRDGRRRAVRPRRTAVGWSSSIPAPGGFTPCGGGSRRSSTPGESGETTPGRREMTVTVERHVLRIGERLHFSDPAGRRRAARHRGTRPAAPSP